MAIVREGAVDNTGNPTTSTSVAIPAGVQNGHLLLASYVNAGAAAAGTFGDNSGVGSWTAVSNTAGTSMQGNIYWKRVSNAASEAGATVSVSGMTDSTCLNLSYWSGVVLSGSPLSGTPVGENNASGNNTQAGITTLDDNSMVCLTIFYSDNTAVTTGFTATDPATLTKGVEIYSSGGGDSGLATSAALKASAGATGAFSWSPGTNQISVSIAFALKPEPPPILDDPIYYLNANRRRRYQWR